MARRRSSGILRAIRRFAREHRGVSAVEFALLLPVMLTIYLGGSEVTQGITIKRKTTIATRTIGDLVAQDVSVTNAEIAAIFAATAAVLAPYPAANLKIVVSSVAIDNNNVARITWSDATGGATARVPNTTVALPTGLNQFPNTSLIWAEAEYTYTPPIGYMITGPMKLNDELFLRPRLVTTITRVP
jgi:Flp pilus assembly protein TadG